MSAARDGWLPLLTDTFAAAEIEAVLSRTVPYVHVPRFLAPAWCDEVIERFNRAIEQLPDHQSLTMGPMLFDTLARPVEMFADTANPEEYFTYVDGDAPRVRALFSGGVDPLEKMRRAWRDAGWSETPAAEDEHRRYHPDVVWGIRRAAAPPHVDTYEHDREIALSRFDRRFNYNVYLQNADAGGMFVAYGRYADESVSGGGRWSFDRVLDPSALHGAARFEHRAAPGDLVIFDAMLYHEVTAVNGESNRRIQVHSSMLLDPTNREFLFFV